MISQFGSDESGRQFIVIVACKNLIYKDERTT
jgi:hypothetical protein